MAHGRKTDIAEIQREERREQVFNLRRNGASFREIARHLNTTEATAHRDYKAVMQRVIEQNTERAEVDQQLDLVRIDALMLRLHPLVFPSPLPSGVPGVPPVIPPPDLKAVDRYLRALDHRARLLGTYAPEKLEGELRILDMAAVKADALRRIQSGELTYEQAKDVFEDDSTLLAELFAGVKGSVQVSEGG